MDKKNKSQVSIIVQMAIFAGILFVSNLLSSLLPSSLPVPSSVIGLILLYGLLVSGVIKLEWVEGLGSFLIGLIGFLFVPSGISVAANLDILAQEGVQLVIVILASTVILLVVTAYVTRAILAIEKSFKAAKKNDKSLAIEESTQA